MARQQDAVEKAHAAGDKKHLGALDPLVEIGAVNPFAPTDRLVKSAPLWARQRWHPTLAAAVLERYRLDRSENGLFIYVPK